MIVNRPPRPDFLINIALPDDTDELTQQSELFEKVCNERMTRPKTSSSDEDESNDDDETWLQHGRGRSR
jgi:hypothetical protein